MRGLCVHDSDTDISDKSLLQLRSTDAAERGVAQHMLRGGNKGAGFEFEDCLRDGMDRAACVSERALTVHAGMPQRERKKRKKESCALKKAAKILLLIS